MSDISFFSSMRSSWSLNNVNNLSNEVSGEYSFDCHLDPLLNVNVCASDD